MVTVPFGVKLAGGEADEHYMPAYDGLNSVSGVAWSLALTAHYAETGKIRHRGHFYGRDAVKIRAPRAGSVVFNLTVNMSETPEALAIAGFAGAVGVNLVSNFVWDLFKRVTDGHLGKERAPATEALRELEERRGGDIAALVAATEPAVRRSHDVIVPGIVNVVNVYGDGNVINTYNSDTKEYVSRSVEDKTIYEKDVSVSSFNANSGYGAVFDGDLGRNVAVQVTKDTLESGRIVLSWGLNEYARGTGRKVSLKFWRIMTMDGRPKKYIVVDAEIPRN